MQDIILLKQGEIVLKGLNKKYFEQKLISNVKHRLRSLGEFDVTCTQSTIYVEPKSDDIDMDETQQAMTKVFGIAAVVRAAACDKTPEAMAKKAIEYMAEAMREAGSFKVETRRADKAFPMTSIEVSQYVGGELAEAFPETAVDVHNPELTVHVEVRERAAYIHRPPLPGAGGLPVGCGGTAVTLLSGGIDSPVSTYMIAKRGVHMIPVHFFSFPYTSELAKQKVLDLAKELTAYCGRLTVEVVPFTHIQTEIRDKCPEEYFTLIMRRFMMRIAPASRWTRTPERSSPAKISVRSPRRRWKRSAAPRPSRVCPCCARSSALTRKRSSACPARSARSSSPRCPTRTAARCSRRATPARGPASTPWRKRRLCSISKVSSPRRWPASSACALIPDFLM